jgi:predicted DNA repair protein MutK
MMKALTILGTAAMFLVGGGILVHGIPPLAAWLHGIEGLAHDLPVAASLFSGLTALIFNAVVGILAGGIAVGIHKLATRLLPSKS